MMTICLFDMKLSKEIEAKLSRINKAVNTKTVNEETAKEMADVFLEAAIGCESLGMSEALMAFHDFLNKTIDK